MKHSTVQSRFVCHILAATLALGALQSPAADSTPRPIDLARQLNEAFVEVSDRVSRSVVVVQVAYSRSERREISLEQLEEQNPWLERLPESLRKYLLPEEEQESPDVDPPSPGGDGEPVYSGNGSGVIISEDGYIMTNHHVVEGADKIRVRLKDGREFQAFVRGTDELSEIAVIKIDDESISGLPVASFANSDQVRVGEYAIAIGTPFALDYSVTVGHVSAKGRAGVVPWYMGGNRMDQDFIQTDANINPGNSGGPLVNLDGEVMGINTLIRGIGTGIGFAVPSNLAREVADKLILTGKFERAWLGIGIRDIREYPAADQVAPGQAFGLVVVEIPRDAPAYGSGLKASDVIVAVDGVKVSDIGELRTQVRSKPLGSTLSLDVVRGTDRITVEVKTGSLPQSQLQAGTNWRPPVPEPELLPLGMTVKELDADTAKRYGLEKGEGVLVTDVEESSAAARQGILPGAVITDINHQSVGTVSDFQRQIQKADPASGVLINYVDANGNSRFVVIKE